VEGGRGKNRQVILVGRELFCFPRVWEGIGVQLGVAKHFLELGLIEGAVDRGLAVSLRWGGGQSG